MTDASDIGKLQFLLTFENDKVIPKSPDEYFVLMTVLIDLLAYYDIF
jgi:hypothetical protein